MKYNSSEERLATTSTSNRKDRRVLVLSEKEEGELAPITLELLQVGRNLADNMGGVLCTALPGHEVAEMAEHIAGFSDEVYCVESPLLETFRSDLYAHFLEKLCRQISPEIILLGQTINNIDLAPKLACRMKATLITDCISIDIDEELGFLLCTKPVYGDRANAVFAVDSRPGMATLRPRSVEPIKESGSVGRISRFNITVDGFLEAIEIIGTVPGDSVSIDKADAIVAGGRGVKGTEGLTVLEGLAESLKKYFDKVELGASRPLIDAGLLPKSRQIGQTGEKVTPQLYVAVAISGSAQHISGIAGSKKIIAINKDADAPIFGVADYGVIGQYESVLPALTGKLMELS